MEYPDLYVRFIYYFNVDRDYYECHEVMEELWLEEGRNPLYQGLLQVAVGLYHFQNQNVSGAIKLMEAALEKLEDFPDEAMGIDLGRLTRETAAYLSKLHHYEQSPFPFYDLDILIKDPHLQAKVEECKNKHRDSYNS
ncbi:MAG: DUF309 domain-containing protein [Bacillaceae bacterium]|nr:DUF309 domain-containing protein [Bacillaceae bacterium]